MFFYLLVLPVIGLMLVTISHLRGRRKHDVVLYRFCQIRRELMAFLRAEGTQLSAGDYRFALRFVSALHGTIHNYKDHKEGMFNFRLFLLFLKRFSESVDELRRIPTSDLPRLQELRYRYGNAMLRGFVVFTPFFRSEMVLRLLSAMARVGGKYFAGRVKKVLVAFRQLADEYGPHTQYGTLGGV